MSPPMSVPESIEGGTTTWGAMNSATTSSSAAATSGGSTSSNGRILALGLFDRDRSLPQEQALERYFDIVIQSKFGHIFLPIILLCLEVLFSM